MKRERQRHIEAFEIWYTSDRSLKTTVERLKVSAQSVCEWMNAFDWRGRAAERDAEVARRLEREAILRKAKMLEEHRKAGELLRRRGTEFFVKSEVKEARDAISAVKTGVDLERTSEGLPQALISILNMGEDELIAERDRLRELTAARTGGTATSGEAGSTTEAEGGEGGGDPVLSEHPDSEAG